MRIEKLIKFLKERFESGIQMFDTPSLVNDYRIPIYVEDDITVLYAPSRDYIEIYGISDEEFERVMKEAKGW
mgnify:FL=1